jgi:hypothetical protein
MRAVRDALVALALAGCSSKDMGSDKPCGTQENPVVLTVSDVQPALGSMVKNQAIVHTFTVVNAPGLFSGLVFATNPEHTAGSFKPATPVFTAQAAGKNIKYTGEGMTWEKSTGAVSFRASQRYLTPDACAYALPNPLFSYTLGDAPSGTGGAGGGGGAGGSGAGGSGGS